jgi:hypothetical protein
MGLIGCPETSVNTNLRRATSQKSEYLITGVFSEENNMKILFYRVLVLSHCATSWKVAGSIPDGVIGIFH